MKQLLKLIIAVVIAELCYGQPTTQKADVNLPNVCIAWMQRVYNLVSSTNANKCHTMEDQAKPFMGYSVANKALDFSYLIVFEKLTWEKAREDCFSRGYYLAHVESDGEFQFLRRVILGNEVLRSERFYWTDGTDQGHEDCWVWTSPQVSHFSSGYYSWEPGQPNKPGKNEDCNGMWKESDFTHHDGPCDAPAYFICKRKTGRPAIKFVTKAEYLTTSLC